MSTQTEESVPRPEADIHWGSRRSARRRALRTDFAALKPTLLVVGALIVVAVCNLATHYKFGMKLDLTVKR